MNKKQHFCPPSGTFSLWCHPKFEDRCHSVVEFIERAIMHSKNGKFLYFLRSRVPGEISQICSLSQCWSKMNACCHLVKRGDEECIVNSQLMHDSCSGVCVFVCELVSTNARFMSLHLTVHLYFLIYMLYINQLRSRWSRWRRKLESEAGKAIMDSQSAMFQHAIRCCHGDSDDNHSVILHSDFSFKLIFKTLLKAQGHCWKKRHVRSDFYISVVSELSVRWATAAEEVSPAHIPVFGSVNRPSTC